MEWALVLAIVVIMVIGEAALRIYRRSKQTETDNARADERCKALSESLAERDETIAELREWVAQLRQQRKEEGQAYLERAAKYENRISELIRQNQNLAERVASLRQEGLPEGGDDFHVEDAEPPKPYSPELQAFYDGIEYMEAQAHVEEFIETRRTAGIDDEQILRELEEGS